MSAERSLRERRRDETLAEIKRAAMGQLATDGPDGLSLRAVARDVGVSVQALYHYFDSRDALVTALVTEAHDALADAVAAAASADADKSPADRVVAVGLAYRAWALEHRGQFLLIYGVPLPDYRAPQGGPTTRAAARLGLVMRDVVYAGWTTSELRRVPPPVEPELIGALEHADAHLALGLAPGAAAAFFAAWGQLHGLVMLEILDHLPWLGQGAPALYEVALRSVVGALEAHRAAPRAG
ncbi:MAG: WHG domain-containing protein [Pseudonocardiales bacterium]|nr:WHG domain-containing protein [Pseudonocardiales bacterium]